jgi:tRNA A-37 threonylcarbamoyl transferase component Bud32
MADTDPNALDDTAPYEEPAVTPGGRSDIYEIVGTVGRGGGGIVLKARDRRLDRHVALKILSGPDDALRLRFEREMRITAKLQHAGVVPIHDTGLWGEDQPFYVMRLVEGQSLKQVLAERTTLAARLQLLPNLLAVAETMAYAHSRAIIHRDLKPSNIIVGSYGETVVIDWGLVKDLSEPGDDEPAGPGGTPEAEGVTVSGQVVGTPTYMPPEQARGDLVDRRADVYALGALLREIITGQAPYSGPVWRDVLARVIAGDLPDAATLAPEAPPDLIAVADKAMARDPDARYPDAGAFVVDLRRYLQGDQVGAYAYAPRERLRKWAARSRGVVWTSAIATVLLVSMGALSLARILAQRDDAIASRREVQRKSNALLREQAARELDQGSALRAYELLQGYPADATDWADVYPLVNRIGLAGLPDFWAHPVVSIGRGSRAAMDADARFVALADRTRLEVWNLGTRRRELTLALGASASGGAVELEAIVVGTHAYFVIARADGELVVVDRDGATTRQHSYRPCGHAGLEDTASQAHEPSIAAACDDGAIVRVDVRDGSIRPVAHHKGAATAVAFDGPDRIVSAGVDGEQVRTREDGTSTSRQLGASLGIVSAQPACHASLAGTRNGSLVISGGASEPSVFEQPIAGGGRVIAAGIDDGCRAAFGLSNNGNLVLVDLVTHKVIATTRATAAAFYPGREALVLGSERGEVDYWEPRSGWRQSWRPGATPVRALILAR